MNQNKSKKQDIKRQRIGFFIIISKVLHTFSLNLDDGKAHELLDIDEDLSQSLQLCNGVLNEYFREAYTNYISGDWSTCKRFLESCLNHNPIDGPTNTLYNVIKEHQFMAPTTWKGYRELTEK